MMVAWLALSFCFAISAWVAIWSRRPTKARGLAVAALLAIVPASGGLLLMERGWAAPIVPYLAELPEGEIDVYGVRLIPEQAIYLMLSVNGEPRLFTLPWNAEAASKLQRLMEGREGTGEIKATKRTGLTERDAFPLELHGTPQKPLPEKQPEAVNRYERSE